MLSEKALETIKWDSNGLIPAIVQDVESKQVLMMAYMSAESLQRSMELGETVFWSRSRQSLWHKGETSGNIQKISEIRIDCDADTLLILVKPSGAACHTGQEHCFYRTLSEFDGNPTRE
jgi:phosphoribosyl-AMP cyclohydrolase